MAKKPKKETDSTFAHSAHIAWRRVEEEAVLLNVDTSEYYSLDPVATDIWERLGKGDKVGKIVKAVAAEYGTPEPRVLKDADQFIRDLLAEKLLISKP